MVNTRRLDRLTQAIRTRLSEIVETGAAEVVTQAKLEIESGVKSGRIYKRPAGDHQASAPGQPAAHDAGDLLDGLSSRLTGPLMATITSAAPHSAVLEFGGVKMAAHPFLLPALQKVEKPFRLTVYRVLDRARR